MSSTITGWQSLRDMLYIIAGIFGAYLEYLYRLFVRPSTKALDGEIILITGAGDGIGKKMCLYLGDSCPNATLVCWDINYKSNEATVKRLRTMGVRAFGYEIDISDRDQVAKCANKVREEVGFVTVIINNAGVLHRIDSFLNLSPAEIDKTFNVNTLAHCWILREFLPKMVERNSGHIVTICSVAGHMGTRNFSLYSASKYAVRGLIESVALEMKSQKVNINFTTVFPGFISTQLLSNLEMRSSLPLPMRTLDSTEVAIEIIDSFRRNEEYVYLPRGSSRFSVFINNILLPKAADATKRVFNFEAINK